MAHFGVDVSSNNPHPINFGAMFSYLEGLGGGGQPFVIVKATQGSQYTNPDFLSDIAAAKAAGFAVGAYLMDEGAADPATEERVYKLVAGTVIPQFDDDELPDGDSTAAYKAHLSGLIAQADVIQYLNQAEVGAGYPEGAGLWLADYNNSPGNTPYPALIHQYTSTGTIPGNSGEFDMNFWMGTEAQFAALFNTAPPAPTPPVPNQGDIIIMGLPSGCTDDGAIDLFVRQTFNDVSVNSMTADELALFKAMFALPSNQNFGGVAGYGRAPNVLYYSIVDYIKIHKPGGLKPSYANAV